MRSTSGRVVVLLAAVVAVMALFLVLRDDGDGGGDVEVSEPVQSTSGDAGKQQLGDAPEILIQGGKPVGGPTDIEVSRGENIEFTVRSDIADEVHLHGYDVSKEVEAGGKVTFDVPADIEGVFSVELEESAVPIAEVTVTPG